MQDRTIAVAAANEAKSPSPYPDRPGWSRDAGTPGAHSEQAALDQGMKARDGSKPEDFALYNTRTQTNAEGNAGDPMPQCRNCVPITKGVNDVTPPPPEK